MHSTTYSIRSPSGVTRREPGLSKYETTLVPFSDTSPLPERRANTVEEYDRGECKRLVVENSATADAAKHARLCTKALPKVIANDEV